MKGVILMNHLDIILENKSKIKNSKPDEIIELTPTKEEEKTLQFGTEPDGRVQACMTISGYYWRCRAEVLIVKDNKILLWKLPEGKIKNGLNYITPGGSMEPGYDYVGTAKKECNEEAKVNIKNCMYSGISYVFKYTNTASRIFNFAGAVTFICTALYDGKFKGHVDKFDETDFPKNAKWYDISEIELHPLHLAALRKSGLIK